MHGCARPATTPSETLPCGIGPVTLGMTLNSLRSIRPAVRPSDSASGPDYPVFSEPLTACPLAERAEYEFDHDSLRAIRLSRDWPLDRGIQSPPHCLIVEAQLMNQYGSPNCSGMYVREIGGTRVSYACRIWERPGGLIVLDALDNRSLDLVLRSSAHAVRIRIIIWFARKSAMPADMTVCCAEPPTSCVSKEHARRSADL